MFALLALICFVLAVFEVALPVNLIALGLAFLTTHFLLGAWPFGGNPPWIVKSKEK